MKILNMFLLFCFIMTGVWSQDVEIAWGNYIYLDERLTEALAKEQELIERQNMLRNEIHMLQENQSWYNGWINEMRVARRSALQVELSDSLQIIQRRIKVIKPQRQEAFSAFKKVYQQIFLTSKSTNELSASEKEQAILLGRRLITQSRGTVKFPDYTSLLDNSYENSDIRKMVMIDLQSLLKAKLNIIDSLMNEKKMELALVNRLNEFHRDLNYEMKSNLDLEKSSLVRRTSIQYSLPPPPAAEPEAPGDFSEFNAVNTDDFNDIEPAGEMKVFNTSRDQKLIVTKEKNMISYMEPIDVELDRLKLKREQYQELLNRIVEELPH